MMLIRSFLLLIFSGCSLLQSQQVDNTTLAKAFASQVSEYPGLGMKFVSKEADNHVLMSKNGRYIVKGTLQDLWEGVASPYVVNSGFSRIPKEVRAASTSLFIGDSTKPTVDIFISYSCKTCKAFTQEVFSDAFLSRYSANIFLVYLSDLDKKIITDIYCSSDKVNSFKRRFLQSDITELSGNCSVLEPKMNVTIASVIPIQSLPATLLPDINKIYYGTISNNILAD